MRSRRPQARGFTLVEMSVVVVITTVLATVAILTYRHHRGVSRMAEATNLTAQIRAAQEAYKAETGVYADVSSSVTSYYPAAAPGSFVTVWGADCTVCKTTDAWRKLTVLPHGAVMYGYATISGIGAIPVGGGSGSGGGSGGGGTTPPSALPPPSSTDPFYVVQAQGDTDGDGVPCTILSTSNNPALIISNEGE
jgi:type IV pilus assembly protein PilA